MQKSKKIISVFVLTVLLCMAIGQGVGAFASTPASQTIKVNAGQSVTVTFSESSCYGVSGSITYSNRELLSSVTPGNSPYGQIREKSFILSSADKIDCTFTLTVKIKDTAAVGEKCVVSFTDYLRVDNNMTLEGPEGLTKTVTLEVVAKEQSKPVTPAPSKPTPAPSTPAPSNPAPSTPDTSKPAPSTPAPSTPAENNAGLDYSVLDKQIGIANTLNEAEYTSDSWTAMKAALAKANSAKKAETQNEINGAASALKNAIASLVRVNAAELQALMQSAKTYIQQDEISNLKKLVEDAIANAEKAIKSGDAEEISAAKTALETALNAYKTKYDELSKGQIVEVEKPVEVTPTSPFCNIAFHKLAIILLIVSFIINLGLGGLIGWYFYKRRQNLRDDTPLVDYDINED